MKLVNYTVLFSEQWSIQPHLIDCLITDRLIAPNKALKQKQIIIFALAADQISHTHKLIFHINKSSAKCGTEIY